MAAVLLAICIVSQFFKNFSVYITGPVINACLILAVITCGVFWASVLAVVTPLTAFVITGAPVMKAVPAIMPLIMLGNLVLTLTVWFFVKKKADNRSVIIGGVAGSILKAAVMALTISYGLLSLITLPEKMQVMLPVLRSTYSLTQLLTALIGTVYAYIIWLVLKKTIYTGH